MPLRQFVAHNKEKHNDNLMVKISWNSQNSESLESVRRICYPKTSYLLCLQSAMTILESFNQFLFK